MGERYWISGVQLGLILAFVKVNNSEGTERLIAKIIDK